MDNFKKGQKDYDGLIFIFMIIAVASGIIYFVYRTWGPKNETPKIKSNRVEQVEEEDDTNVPDVITTDELKEKLEKKEDIVLLDVQDRESYISKHIPNAINIPLEELANKKDKLPKEKEIIVMSAGEKIDKCGSCREAAKTLATMGFPHIRYYKEGIAAWEEEGLPLIIGNTTSYKNINIDQLKQEIDDKEDIMIVDIRDKAEYDNSHIKGAIHMPFEGILDKIDTFPRNKKIIFYDETGTSSKLVVEQFVKNGLIYAENLVDGFKLWKEKGYPTE